ncbi:MAG TPA: alpha/beta hydrolase-fold protein [Bacteroidia bacterium]|jgi:predicted alpha/beta superfamily hydrolase|nr:alpha/beta hydrolase-fold protein [Bacteroidia bacterium]
MIHKALFLFLCAVLSGSICHAQSNTTKPFVLGIVHELNSTVLSEKRILNIYLPEGYNKDSATTYPVIYLLDGSADEDFIHIAGLCQFLTMIGTLPKSIVVGIGNVDRRRDFTFPTRNKKDLQISPTSGGSEKFMLFLEKELEPYVEQHFKTNASKTIIGQSLGGLLAIQVLLKKPALFTDYIIVSPSLWWDDESLLPDMSAKLKPASVQGAHVFIAWGNEGPEMQKDVETFMTAAKAVENQKFKTTAVSFPEETHATILHRAVYKGLEVLNAKH